MGDNTGFGRLLISNIVGVSRSRVVVPAASKTIFIIAHLVKHNICC